MLRTVALLVLIALALWAQIAAAQDTSVRFVVGNDVAAGDEAVIREGIQLAEGFTTTALGIDPLQGVTVTVRTSNIDDRFVAEAKGTTVLIQTGHPLWIDTYPPLRRQQNPIHEYFHLVQVSLADQVVVPGNLGPLWLVEGSAEYFGWRALVEAGIVSADDIRAYHMANVAFSPPMGPLSDYEHDPAFYTFGSSYSLGYLAVELLVESAGIASLAEFYQELANAPDWPTAFTTTFGQAPDTFYALFEETRWSFGNVDPSNPFLGSLQMPAFPAEGAFAVAVTAHSERVPVGGQGMTIGATAPGALCSLDIAAPDGSVILSYPATADTLGTVFWLWSVPDAITPGSATVAVSCGSTPVVVAVEMI